MHHRWYSLWNIRASGRARYDTCANECYALCDTLQDWGHFENHYAWRSLRDHWKMAECTEELDEPSFCLHCRRYCKADACGVEDIQKCGYLVEKDHGKSCWAEERHSMLSEWYPTELSWWSSGTTRLLLEKTWELLGAEKRCLPSLLLLLEFWSSQDSLFRIWPINGVRWFRKAVWRCAQSHFRPDWPKIN